LANLLADVRAEFRPLASWPPGLRFLSGPTERVMQAQLPPRPDAHSYTGSTADLAANSEFAERGGGDFAVERRARDTERKRRKRVGARGEPRVSKIRFLPPPPAARDPARISTRSR
jgi:hypothetical protein